MRNFVSLVLIVFLLALTVSVAVCVLQPADNESEPVDPLLEEFSDDYEIYIKNLTSVIPYVITEGNWLKVNLTEEEMQRRAVKVAAAYAGTYNETYNTKKMGWYTFNWNEFHLSIARAYDLTDEEIHRYIPASRRPNTYGYHNLPVPDSIYDDVLDPEHKAPA